MNFLEGSADQCWIAMLIACGGTRSFAGLLVARFFQGAGGCMYCLLSAINLPADAGL